MKKIILFVSLFFLINYSVFARGANQVETVELCFAFGTEEYLKTVLEPGYEIKKTHKSDIGSNSINQEIIRDIQIVKNINGEETEVCYIYPYYEGKEPTEIKAKLPLKVILDNREKSFDELRGPFHEDMIFEEMITLCFAIETDDPYLLQLLTTDFNVKKCLNYIKELMHPKTEDGRYIDYYSIRNKIMFE